jgi:hypothetical protein
LRDDSESLVGAELFSVWSQELALPCEDEEQDPG